MCHSNNFWRKISSECENVMCCYNLNPTLINAQSTCFSMMRCYSSIIVIGFSQFTFSLEPYNLEVFVMCFPNCWGMILSQDSFYSIMKLHILSNSQCCMWQTLWFFCGIFLISMTSWEREINHNANRLYRWKKSVYNRINEVSNH